MATTITPATLTATITDSVVLNGKTYGNSNTLTIPNVNEVDERIVTVPTSEITIVNYGAANAAGTFTRSGVVYGRFTNKDDTNFISLHIISATDDAWIYLGAGKTFELHNGKIETASTFSAWADITSISAIADTAAVDLEYLVAST
jgi:hypothetical protein